MNFPKIFSIVIFLIFSFDSFVYAGNSVPQPKRNDQFIVYTGLNKIGEKISIEVSGDYPDMKAILKITGLEKTTRVIEGGNFYEGNGRDRVLSYGPRENETDRTAVNLGKAAFNSRMVCQSGCTERVPNKFIQKSIAQK